jgi:hypothetical protein
MKTNFLRIILCLGTIFFYNAGMAQNSSKNVILEQLYGKDGEQYFSFQSSGHDQVNELGRIISVDKVDQTGVVYAYANRKEFSKFLDYNIDYKILPHPGDYKGYLKMLHSVDTRNIEAWDFYPTYDAYVDMMYQYATDYPDLCQVFSIGQTNDGRELLIAKISDNVTLRENEPQFLYTSSIHGDETTGYILMLRLIDYLLSNHGTDPRLTSLVDNIEIWINPLANPDGTYAGGNDTVSGARRYNANWIDINRNFPDPEDGQHPDGEDWQVETQHFMAMAESNHFVSSCNLHGGEEVCNYPWDTWSKLSADDAWWQYVCHEYADTAHLYSPPDYMSDFDNGITNGYQWYTISGGRQDYMNFFQQCREFTLEISDTKLLPSNLLPTWWNYSYRSLLNYMEQSTFGLRGTVKDSVTGWPLKAEVYVVLHEMDSSWVYSALPNGNYHRLLNAGSYNVRFSSPGYYQKVYYGVNIVNRQATNLDVQLVPNGVGGIDNYQVNRMISMYPNPLSGNSLFFDSEIKIDRVVVYNLDGRELKEFFPESTDRSIDIQSLNAGIYFIRFDTSKGSAVKKFVVND